MSVRQIAESPAWAELIIRLYADGFSFEEAVQLAFDYFAKRVAFPAVQENRRAAKKSEESPVEETPKSEGGEA
jgi:hypothetical protein